MITKIAIQNFKSLKNIEMSCSSLNLLSGLNGMGKSSVIQALLLLRQSYDKGYLQKHGLSLKGDLVNIGTGKDAFYQNGDIEQIFFELLFENMGEPNKWIFDYSKNDGIKERNYADADVLPLAEYTPAKFLELDSLPLFNASFRYLNADRWVRNEYGKSDFQVKQNRTLGKHGEYTTNFLIEYGNSPINEKLLYPESEVNTLIYQVSAWMHEISPNTTVIAEDVKGIDAVKLRYTFKTDSGPSNEFLPTNVGFGITYVLPVVVALLSAKAGDILILENPESHLHPKGQSAIGKLMAKVAEIGVQIFVESHSDHILNGIRVAVKNGIPADFINLFFFSRGSYDYENYTALEKPILDNDGRIDQWPENFFDEWEKTLMNII